MTSLVDAYSTFVDRHNGAPVLRTAEELRAVIFEVGYTYETLDTRFWDILLHCGWSQGTTEDLPPTIVRD